MRIRHACIIAPFLLASTAAAQPAWQEAEAPILTHTTALTASSTFYKAGEQYFSPDMQWMIFQGVPTPEAGQDPDAHYSMYVAKFIRDEEGNITGTEDPILVSPPGSASTCGWFHPINKGEIMFGSTLIPPGSGISPGYKGPNKSKYTWEFPHEMEIVTRTLAVLGAETDSEPTPMFTKPGYDAEGSYSPDGRYILYAHVDEERSAQIGRPDADLYVYDTKTDTQIPMVIHDGYDGGPFFSPDMNWICYRSDRLGDANLQLFVAEIDYAPDGSIKGIKREVQLTDNDWVNWAPYFHPSGRFMVYTSSELGHTNYEVFAIEFDPDKPMDELWKVRITHADSFDGLPVLSPDGKTMIWCAQRGDMTEGETRPSSQIWSATFDAKALLQQANPDGSF
ncbi:tolB protein precursor, periplasmic protein involved in the tonb-independent uptake of group A colicins [hydrothermal vent metagenome]|uniref:TolB protein, periplasmic protein involved in the tonb-independent uptake of group A colicins n=1 Tax=hydrothermal vent metagenome TaxID=652676 RepID=A0A3B1D0Y6_9ZZZZ